MRTIALMQVADRRLELTEREVPPIGRDAALLEVESCGLCGSDVEQFKGSFSAKGLVRYPLIPGHEPVGRIVEIGAEAQRNWKLKVGDRVAVEPHISCGRCHACTGGSYNLCKSLLPSAAPAYGYLPLDFEHGLWGGYSRHMYLHPRSILHKLPEDLPLEVATQYQLLAAGIRWAVHVPESGFGDTVLILGCGQRGLGAVIACAQAGVGRIIVTGLARDAHKLALARDLGAHHSIVADQQNVVEQVMLLTNGRGADVALDVTPGATQPVIDAIEAVRLGGTVVLAGIKGGTKTVPIDTDKVVYKEIRLRGVFTQTRPAYEQAIALLTRSPGSFARLHTHSFPLERTAEAIEVLSGEREDGAICISIRP
jgi:threonine dehydrogenase-like Zn-dependent dehydrogenase